MNRINYDFSGLEDAVGLLKRNQSPATLASIKRELNKFFNDSVCREVIFTKNYDKTFFGMCVIPYISGDIAAKIMATDEKMRLDTYYVEIDSKLLDIDFTQRELTAMLLHEVGHIVNDSQPVEVMRKSIDSYLHNNDSNLVITKSNQYRDLLAFGIKQGIRNVFSLFKKEDDEIIADQFSVACGYGKDLESAYSKIVRYTSKLNRGVPKLAALQWTLRLYKDVKLRRISALRVLNKYNNITGSTLEKREVNSVKRDLNQIDDSSLIQENVFQDYLKNMYTRFKYKGIRALSDDVYELQLRIKNVDEEDEALAIIRKINTNMAIIDDYMNTEKLSEEQKKNCFDLMDKYSLLRKELSKKTTYDQKYYGLFVKTPVIKSRYDV